MNIYTTSATIIYLMVVQKQEIGKIANVIGEDVEKVIELKRGKGVFTKQQYLKLIEVYPMLEGCVEYYENVKRSK